MPLQNTGTNGRGKPFNKSSESTKNLSSQENKGIVGNGALTSLEARHQEKLISK